jgi:hypothetical protein
LIPVLAVALAAGRLSAAGPSGADYLLAEPAARTAGLADADAAVGGELEAFRSNPAGLASVQGLQVAVSHLSEADDWNHEWMALGMPIAGGVGAVEFLESDMTPFTLYDGSGQSYATATVSSQNLAFGWGMPVLADLDLGVDARGFRSQLYTYSNEGYAVDVGLRFEDRRLPVTLGMAIQNLGAESAYIAVSDPLPTRYRAGAEGHFRVSEAVAVSLRTDIVEYQDPTRPQEIRFGAETAFYKDAFIRCGWVHTAENDGLCMGLGVKWENLSLDYSYQPSNLLGDNELIELTLAGK